MAKPRDPEITSRIMARVRRRDTRPEIAVRRALWAGGMRYRVDYKGAEGRPDIAFPGSRVAVFVDGDFWHGNAWRLRGYSSPEQMFPTRTEWWVNKIQSNITRDLEVTRCLEADGWTVLRFWESEIQENLERVVREIVRAVG